jgi:tRNA-specific 2-thiouridylase
MNGNIGRCPSMLLELALTNIYNNHNIKAGDRILAAMSGGIDSSVMAAILHHAKLDVVGVSMQLFDKTNDIHTTNCKNDAKCCTIDDFHDARRVAFKFGFPHYVMNFENQFKDMVISPFINDYISGKTPSPCIRCNQHIKFGTLMDTATKLGCKFIATGHYARISQDINGYHLLKSSDAKKDQSYFLFTHNQKSLERTLFPLDRLSKNEVRQLAKYLEIHIADKNDSQEICFISDHYYDYINKNKQLPITTGHIRHIDGQILGNHSGYWKFTVGQRKGIGVSYPTPLFVVRTDPTTNVVWVGENKDLLELELLATGISWCLRPPQGNRLECLVKIRSRSPESTAIIQLLGNNSAKIIFNSPQRAIAPGQAAVFYSENEILGGGWIESQAQSV